MSCNRTVAGKASLTRIPPPICVPALGPQLALNWKTGSAANDLSDSMPDFACNGPGRDSYANGISFASAK